MDPPPSPSSLSALRSAATPPHALRLWSCWERRRLSSIPRSVSLRTATISRSSPITPGIHGL
eukprot:4898637-Pyramimonas_sp.AAC.1